MTTNATAVSMAELCRGELFRLRRSDVHLLLDSRPWGCEVVGAHLHVIGRDSPDRAWSKSRRQRKVPPNPPFVESPAPQDVVESRPE